MRSYADKLALISGRRGQRKGLPLLAPPYRSNEIIPRDAYPPEVGDPQRQVEAQEMEIRIPVNNYYREPEGLRKYLCKFYGEKISQVSTSWRIKH